MSVSRKVLENISAISFFPLDFPDGIEDDGFYSKVFEIDLVRNLVNNLKLYFMFHVCRRQTPSPFMFGSQPMVNRGKAFYLIKLEFFLCRVERRFGWQIRPQRIPAGRTIDNTLLPSNGTNNDTG